MYELNTPDFRLLVGLTLMAVIEGITYAWIEVLLYTSDQVLLMRTWVFGHFTSYSVVLAVLVLVMIFGTGFVAWTTYSPTRFRKFFLLALGDFLLWIMLEDEFTFIFSRAPHTPTDWTNWIFGVVNVSGRYIPVWYMIVSVVIFFLWYLGLNVKEENLSDAEIRNTQASISDNAPDIYRMVSPSLCYLICRDFAQLSITAKQTSKPYDSHNADHKQ